MSTAALARGARVNRDGLNQLLQSHNLPSLSGPATVRLREQEVVNALFRKLGLDSNTQIRAIAPYASGAAVDGAPYLIIGYEWNYVLHAKKVGEALPKNEVPTGFEAAVHQIDPHARHGVWCVTLTGEQGMLLQDFAASNVFTCGLDQQTFASWDEFDAHNLSIHNLSPSSLPYA